MSKLCLKEITMEINNVLKKPQLLIANRESDKKNMNEGNGRTKVQPAGDPVKISQLISHLNQMMTSDVTSRPGNDRVAMLKSSIEAGTYSVSGIAVASKMLGIE
jgi:anti-sigma28 factor (negative regulator of flagellin synthesis)